MKKYLVLFLVLLCIGASECKKDNCDNEYDDCCASCYKKAQITGHYTDCYENCWKDYDRCENQPLGGCFIDNI